jgi:hypothetical protein
MADEAISSNHIQVAAKHLKVGFEFLMIFEDIKRRLCFT